MRVWKSTSLSSTASETAVSLKVGKSLLVGSSDDILVPSSLFVRTTGGVGNRSAHVVVLYMAIAAMVADSVAFSTALISAS